TFGVDLNRRNVERALGLCLSQQETRDAVHGHADAAMKTKPDPWRVVPLPQWVRLALNLQGGTLRIVRVNDPERNVHCAAAFDEGILRAFELAFHGAIGRAQQIAVAALEAPLLEARREVREAALCAPEVGRAHRREHPAIEVIRRERDGDAQNGAANRVPAQNLPEWLALAPHFDRRTR